LLITQEECAEVTQAISKVFRFGFLSQHNGKSNRQHLAEELGDLQCMIDLLIGTGMVTQEELDTAKEAKRKKLEKWSTIFKEAA
jgi:NTP pyrophosphatase (non-canonical NTP hydrolase)